MWQPIAWQVPPISKTIPKQLHVTSRPATRAGQLSLIIPNAPTPGPPTSSAVLVNLGSPALITNRPLLTELETRLPRFWEQRISQMTELGKDGTFINGSPIGVSGQWRKVSPSNQCAKSASNPKRFANTSNCRLSGWVVPSSHERAKAVATPIFAATWPGVRFFCIRLT